MADNDFPRLVRGMVRIIENPRQRIDEDPQRFIKTDAMLASIRQLLAPVPFKIHSTSVYSPAAGFPILLGRFCSTRIIPQYEKFYRGVMERAS